MKKLFAIAAFLLASTAAQAQYTIDYNGQTIRIDPDRGTVSIPGVYDNTGKPAKRARSNQGQQPSRQAGARPGEGRPADTRPPRLPTQLPHPQTQRRTSRLRIALPRLRASAPAPQAQQDAVSTKPASHPVVATRARSRPSAAPAQPANSPLGIWLTEQKEGKIRIEPCGANLCGYSIDPKTNLNRTQILIDMKPDKDSKWSGHIFDPKGGSTYDSTIALKGPDSLRVQGCAFGGIFCGGQTWTRVN